jgi:hypothetical protein
MTACVGRCPVNEKQRPTARGRRDAWRGGQLSPRRGLASLTEVGARSSARDDFAKLAVKAVYS